MIAIEKEFDDCVKKMGGEKISEIVGPSPKFLNADYMFGEYDVIAELKCLQGDKIKDDRLRDKASKIYERYLRQGKAPVVVFGTRRITTEGFPDEFRREIGELYRQPIHTVIKKANQQIRETKEHLEKESSHGLLILANDGHTALDPSHAMWILHETFTRYSFSSIDSIIYFTVNLKAEHPGIDKDILVWIPSHRSPENKCPEQLLNRLQKNWFDHVGNITGEVIEEIQASDQSVINEITNI
jgi:hypothetical protein